MQLDPKTKPPTYSIFRSDCHLPAMYSADRRLRPVDPKSYTMSYAKTTMPSQAPHVTASTIPALQGPGTRHGLYTIKNKTSPMPYIYIAVIMHRRSTEAGLTDMPEPRV